MCFTDKELNPARSPNTLTKLINTQVKPVALEDLLIYS